MNTQCTMIELAEDEIENVSGGIVPLIPVAIAFGKGFLWGVGAANAAHIGYQGYQLMAK